VRKCGGDNKGKLQQMGLENKELIGRKNLILSLETADGVSCLIFHTKNITKKTATTAIKTKTLQNI
jgi:hypothetical protein